MIEIIKRFNVIRVHKLLFEMLKYISDSHTHIVDQPGLTLNKPLRVLPAADDPTPNIPRLVN